MVDVFKNDRLDVAFKWVVDVPDGVTASFGELLVAKIHVNPVVIEGNSVINILEIIDLVGNGIVGSKVVESLADPNSEGPVSVACAIRESSVNSEP